MCSLLPRKLICPLKNGGWKITFLLKWLLLGDIRSSSGVYFESLAIGLYHFKQGRPYNDAVGLQGCFFLILGHSIWVLNQK